MIAAPRPANYIRAYSGKRVVLTAPRPETIDIEDIAHALARVCRFVGHTAGLYTVAQHSVFVSELVPPRDALWGLLHDAAEAYIGDLPSPVKNLPGMGIYRVIENRLLACICQCFGLPVSMPESVVLADKLAIATEFRDLTPVRDDFEWIIQECGVPPLLDRELTPWPAGFAEDRFLSRFKALQP